PCTSRTRRSQRPLPASGSPSYAIAKAVAEALVAFGGNIGDARDTLDRAITAFCDGEKVRLLARSSDYRTAPWGVEDQPPFVNLCVAVETSLTPRALLARAQAVERALGRERDKARPNIHPTLAGRPFAYRSRSSRRLVVGPPPVAWHFVTMPDPSADDLPLAAEFPAATREQWRRLVADVLKGAPFDKRLVAK